MTSQLHLVLRLRVTGGIPLLPIQTLMARSTPSSAEVKSEGRYTSTPRTNLCGEVMDNFTFTDLKTNKLRS